MAIWCMISACGGGCRSGFKELRAIDGDETDTPAALLTIAIVHASGGHKFHWLQLCVDVLQGVRVLQTPEAASTPAGGGRA